MKRFSRLMHSGKHRNKHYFFQAKVEKTQRTVCLFCLSHKRLFYVIVKILTHETCDVITFIASQQMESSSKQR